MKHALLAIIVAITAFWIAVVGPICWLLRDGLGPDSVTSRGMQAVTRFLLTFAWGPVALVMAGACVWLWRLPDGHGRRRVD